MSDLNALIAQGIQFKEPPDPFAQYAQMQQLTQGVQANQLNQMKMQEYQRGLQEQEGARNYLKVTPNFDPTNPTHQTGLMQVAPTTAPKLLESFLTTRKTVADIGKSTAETGELAAKTLDANLANFNKFYSPISAAAAGPQGVQDYMTALYGDPILGSVAARMKPFDVAIKENLAAYQADPKNWVAAHSNINGEQILNTLKGTLQTTNLGGTSQQQTIDAYGRPVAGTQVSKPMTPVPSTEAALMSARAQRGQLGVAQSGLGLRALAADPFNLAGAQDKFPLGAGGGAPAPVVAGAAPTTAPKVAPVAAPTLGGGKVSLNDAIKQGLKGNDLLAAMPAPLAAQVAAITDHRAAPPARNTARGDQLIQLVQMVDPTYDSTSYGTKAGVEKAFASGRAGDTVRSFGVIQNHLDTLAQAGAALQNGDTQLLNKAGNAIASWTGEPAPAGFDAVKRIVAGEIVKAVTGAAGALGDRNAVDAVINAASSPAQLNDVIQKYKALIEGQVGGFRQQYKAGGGAKDFDTVFLGRTGTPAATAPAAGVDTSNKWLK